MNIRSLCSRVCAYSKTLFCGFTAILSLLAAPASLTAQTQDLTAVVLINSSDTADFNTNAATPGTYQMGPERYLVNLQIPYRLVDVSTTAAFDLTDVQLIIAGQNGLNPSAAWQAAIQTAVSGGTGFVNLDSSLSIGAQTHILNVFGATGATVGTDQTSIVVPAAVQVGGATPHYIAALQRHFTGDPAGDLTYTYHGNGTVVIPSDATILTGAKGTVVAELGTDPLIIATTYGKGRAVDFTTYDWMHQDRFGFVEGVDDLFWRSLVWAARKPFVLRGYPRLTAVQMDDNESGVMSRLPDLWNTTLTGTVAADGTGGPWTPQLNMQLSGLEGPGGDRAALITAINSNLVHASPHGLDYGSGGDLYWNLTIPVTDAQWLSNVASVQTWQKENGGTDTFPKFGRSMVAHYWDISTNVGYDMWNTLGLRYITSPQAPGAYYFTVPKTPAQRIPLGPYRIYEQPPLYTGDEEETFPFFFADDLTVGSVAGKPAQTFYSFGSQVGLSAGRFSRPDAVFPSTQNGYTVAQSLNQWEYYMWRFWSGMTPVQIYTHDGSNLEYATVSDRQTFITQISQWFGANRGYHVFMDSLGDYLRARNHSLLATASLSNTALTLNFTGSATDADGNLIPTKTYVFYGDDEGTFLSIPGFANGGSFSFPNTQPASLQVSPGALTFTASQGGSPASQTVNVSNVGTGSFAWTVASSATWLTSTPANGTTNTSAQVSINSSALAAGSYTATLTFTGAGALNSPLQVPVTLTIAPTKASFVARPTALSFTGSVGGTLPPAQVIAITNPSLTSLTWTATSNASWLVPTITTNGTPGAVSVAVNPGSLALGSYSAAVTITSTSNAAAPITIPVTLQLAGAIDSPSTASLSAWTISPLGNLAGWTASGGSLHYNGGGETQLYTGTATWTDYDLDVNFTLSNLSDYPGGIRARVNPANGSGYALWLYPADHSIKLYSVVNWNISNGYTALASASNVVFDTNPHTLQLSAHGSVISAYLDGTQILSVTDTTYTTGLIALDPSGQPIAFNSVTVNSSVVPVNSLVASPTTLAFSSAPGGLATAQSIALSSTLASVGWTASSSVPWLTLTPSTGTATPGSISVGASAAGLANGTYTGVITITPTTGTATQVAVTLTVSTTMTATIQLTPAELDVFSAVGSSPPPVTVQVQNSGTGSLPWSATSGSTWLVPSPTSSSAAGTLTLTPSTNALAAGAQLANVTVSSSSATNGSVVLPVTAHLGTLIFSDTFANGSTQWTPSPLGLAANWSVANNTFKYNGNGHTQQYAGSQTWTNYIVSTNMTLSDLSNYPGGLRGRVNLTTGVAYVAWIYPADHVIKLFRTAGWNIDTSGLTQLGQSAVMLFDTNTHALRLGFSGNRITVYYDNTQVISATDTVIPSGAIALDVSSQPVSFSNVTVLQ